MDIEIIRPTHERNKCLELAPRDAEMRVAASTAIQSKNGSMSAVLTFDGELGASNRTAAIGKNLGELKIEDQGPLESHCPIDAAEKILNLI